VRWRRLGAATLVSLSIALTALAAQVGPPNADNPAPVAADPGKKERKEIELSKGTLNRYVGTYKFGDSMIMTVSRKGAGLQAQMTGQPAIEIFAESERSFFYKALDAQIDFVGDGGTPATSLVLHQGGNDYSMPRIDEATVAQMKTDVAARISSNAPAPGTEAAVRKMAAALSAGSPNYDDMTPEIANTTRSQMPHLGPAMQSLGAVQSIEFVRVGEGGWDVYRVKYANGSLMWRVGLNPGGKISYAALLPDA
jgi:hypothetical protein